MLQTLQISALRNDAQILVHGQYLGSPCTENRLRIGQDYFIHDVCLACLKTSIERSPLSLSVLSRQTR
jgi:hypothetical protein